MIPISHIHEAARQVIEAVADRAAGVLIHDPATDARFPDTSDLDFVVLGDVDDLCSQRMRLKMPDGAHVMVDLTRLPWELVRNAEGAATRGLLPHRLLTAHVVWDAGKDIRGLCKEIRSHMYFAEAQKKRALVLYDVGYETVREIGFTWDFPSLVLFWLHMAYASCLGAFLDGLRVLCPNVCTRPFDYAGGVESTFVAGVHHRCVSGLHLDVDPIPMFAAVKRIHAVVASGFPEPVWLPAIRSGTRFEYRYWLSTDEIDWRLSVAEEMVRRHDTVSAVFYLSFCAYALARIPMVHAYGMNGNGSRHCAICNARMAADAPRRGSAWR